MHFKYKYLLVFHELNIPVRQRREPSLKPHKKQHERNLPQHALNLAAFGLSVTTASDILTFGIIRDMF